MKRYSFYSSSLWKKLSRFAKSRDGKQCQICGDREGAPYCELHAHHIVPRSQGGPDELANIITLCDLCHAVLTKRWHKPWFGKLNDEQKQILEEAREGFAEFLALDPPTRDKRQALIWQQFGRPKSPVLLPIPTSDLQH